MAPCSASSIRRRSSARAWKRGLEEADVVAGAVLGAIEREVGVADHLLDGVAVARADRDADAGADEQPLVAVEEGTLKRADQREAELLEFVAALDLRHDDGELVAAQPAGGHLVGDHGLEAARYLLQEMVAGDMAERIVDRLEAVEVDQQCRAFMTPALAAAKADWRLSSSWRRLGRPVRASWRAMWAIRSAAWRASVTSEPTP